MPGKPQAATIDESKLRELDLAYLAGLVDGDGSVRAQLIAAPSRGSRKPRTSYSIVVYNYNREVMEWLVSRFGGFYVSNPKRAIVGTNGQSYVRKDDSFTWVMTRTRDVEIVLRRMIRYMIIKQTRAIYIFGEVRKKL